MSDGSQKPPHRIRIHAAWERVEIDADGNLSEPRRVILPDSSQVNPTTCRLLYTRKFNSPTGLQASDRVVLHCELLAIANQASLNQMLLPSETPSGNIDIMPMLLNSNELVIEIAADRFASISNSTAYLMIH